MFSVIITTHTVRGKKIGEFEKFADAKKFALKVSEKGFYDEGNPNVEGNETIYPAHAILEIRIVA